jgi:hypothetical protein
VWDLFRLFAEAAHRTVEALITAGRAGIDRVVEALIGRYGVGDVFDRSAVGQLIEEVNDAIQAGDQLTRGRPVDPAAYGVNPAMDPRYSYTVIGRIVNPLDPRQESSIPWTIRSDRPLTSQEIRREAVHELTEWRGPRYEEGEHYATDLIRRDIQFQQFRESWGQGADSIDITVLSAYRQR